MTIKDLQIGSPVYRISLDKIDVARVCSIEALFVNGTRKIKLATGWSATGVAKEDATEIICDETDYPWYLNVEDAELAQLMRRSEHVEMLKKKMEETQNAFAEAVQKYAFAEPSTPKEL